MTGEERFTVLVEWPMPDGGTEAFGDFPSRNHAVEAIEALAGFRAGVRMRVMPVRVYPDAAAMIARWRSDDFRRTVTAVDNAA